MTQTGVVVLWEEGRPVQRWATGAGGPVQCATYSEVRFGLLLLVAL